jgi:hypothetical protein
MVNAGQAAVSRGRVLVVGVYLVDQEHAMCDIAAELDRSREWTVEQKWVALGGADVPAGLRRITAAARTTPAPKFALLNELLASVRLDDYAFVVVCDDDISLPPRFVDSYLELVSTHGFALAQPARTHASYIDHPFVEQLAGIDARLTRFVEIVPLFSMRRDATALIVPFDESSPMGWGYDFAWPVLLQAAGLRLGIVDATPVEHTMRRTLAHYDYDPARGHMDAYLTGRPHVTPGEAFVIIESYG